MGSITASERSVAREGGLVDDLLFIVQPTLIRKLGAAEAILAQQVHYMCRMRQAEQIDGDWFVRMSYKQWDEHTGLTAKTVRGAADKLVKLGLLIVQGEGTTTRAYRIDYDALASFAPAGKAKTPNFAPAGKALCPTGQSNSAPAGKGTVLKLSEGSKEEVAVPNGTAGRGSSASALPGLETSPKPPPIATEYIDAVRAYKAASKKLTDDSGFPVRNDRADPAIVSGCSKALTVEQARNAPKVFAWALTRTAWPQQIQNRVIWTKPDAWQRLWADWMANTQNANQRGSPTARQEQMQRLRRGEGNHPDQPAGVHVPPPLSDD